MSDRSIHHFDSPGPITRGEAPEGGLLVELVRDLDIGDIPALKQKPLSENSALVPSLMSIRSAHHGLAQMLAKGDPIEKVSLFTGYSASYISRLQKDPTFRELLSYYATEREQVFIDAMKRLSDLGITAIEELQDRLATAPEGFTNREIMELTELALLKGKGTGNSGSNSNSPNVAVTVSFVSALPEPTPVGQIIDLKPEVSPR